MGTTLRKGVITLNLNDAVCKVNFSAEVATSVNPDSHELVVAVKLRTLSLNEQEGDLQKLPQAFLDIVTSSIADQVAADHPASDYRN